MTCPYITVLERECGRAATLRGYCDLHSVLAQLDVLTLDDLAQSTWSSSPVLDRVRTRLIQEMEKA